MVKKIPEGFTTITPTLNLKNAADAIALYIKAFGAKEILRVVQPDGSGKIMHATLQVGTSQLFVADVNEKMGCNTPSLSNFYLYVDDVDAAFAQAVKAGLSEDMKPQDMFYGDRVASVKDKFGISWAIATHVRDVSDDEIKTAMKDMASKAA